jgi:6,7-dimethyl-8-ribityllumazine synthase
MQHGTSIRTAVPDGRGLRIAIVVSRFNEEVTARLRDGATEALRAAGVLAHAIQHYEVPGAFELPMAARALAVSGHIDAVVCLGCVIRGETPHFEYISSAVAHGVMQAALDTGVPVTFGVLTTDTLEQAHARSQPGPSNKGFEAACAAVEMGRLAERLLGTGPRAPRNRR